MANPKGLTKASKTNILHKAISIKKYYIDLVLRTLLYYYMSNNGIWLSQWGLISIPKSE